MRWIIKEEKSFERGSPRALEVERDLLGMSERKATERVAKP
jgi:hypothetical protein